MRAGDTFIVWKLDRLGRSLKELIELTNQLQARNINFISIQEGFDTSTPGGKLISFGSNSSKLASPFSLLHN